MKNENLNNLKNFNKTLKRINKKFRLLNLLVRAKEEYDKNNYHDCIKNCEEILKQDNTNAIALRGLGCSMQSLGNRDEALKYYNLALKYSQNKEIEYTLIGTIFYNENNFDEAIKYYNLAIDTNDNYSEAYNGRNQSVLEKHLQIADLQDELISRHLF